MESAFLLLTVAISASADTARRANAPDPRGNGERAPANPSRLTVQDGPDLPVAIANNAVAASTVDRRDRIFTFLGLRAGKDYRSITTEAYAVDVNDGRWEQLPDVPGAAGRLAATAQALGRRVYLFGGYSVAADGKETTSPAVDVYDVGELRYSRGADIPVPIDDTVSGVWRDRLVFLVSGWSTSRNVDAVQVYNAARNRWATATPIPGTPVFGHAGGIAGDTIVYCGGARMHAPAPPKYVPNAECYRGDINPGEPTTIAWRAIAHHPGPARYRAAAGRVQIGDRVGIMFAGGTINPYNYDGMGYDGKPSEPVATSWIYDIDRDVWFEGPRLATPSMDHRGLVAISDSWWIVGGFGAHQTVSSKVARFRVEPNGR